MRAHHRSHELSAGQIHTQEETAIFLQNFTQSFEREKNAFRQLPPELLAGRKGMFVAFSGGEIIDQDRDELSLAKRVSLLPKDKFILIKLIDDALSF